MVDRSRANDKIKYKCICDCGNLHIVSGDSLRSGRSKSCGCLKREFVEKNKFQRIEDREYALLRVQYSHLKRRNKLKEFGDNIIDFDTFVKLSKSPCYYCGLTSSRVIEDRISETKKNKKVSSYILKINGIDRLNNNIGYIDGNVVTCCKYCNSAKGVMSKEEFLDWVNRIYNYQKKQ